jgi:hypothetical protein
VHTHTLSPPLHTHALVRRQRIEEHEDEDDGNFNADSGFDAPVTRPNKTRSRKMTIAAKAGGKGRRSSLAPTPKLRGDGSAATGEERERSDLDRAPSSGALVPNLRSPSVDETSAATSSAQPLPSPPKSPSEGVSRPRTAGSDDGAAVSFASSRNASSRSSAVGDALFPHSRSSPRPTTAGSVEETSGDNIVSGAQTAEERAAAAAMFIRQTSTIAGMSIGDELQPLGLDRPADEPPAPKTPPQAMPNTSFSFRFDRRARAAPGISGGGEGDAATTNGDEIAPTAASVPRVETAEVAVQTEEIVATVGGADEEGAVRASETGEITLEKEPTVSPPPEPAVVDGPTQTEDAEVVALTNEPNVKSQAGEEPSEQPAPAALRRVSPPF